MKSFILRENVLSDNVLHIADENKVFSGGYVAVLHEYTFQNAWTDKMNITKFRSKKRLSSYLSKNYSKEELGNIEL